MTILIKTSNEIAVITVDKKYPFAAWTRPAGTFIQKYTVFIADKTDLWKISCPNQVEAHSLIEQFFKKIQTDEDYVEIVSNND